MQLERKQIEAVKYRLEKLELKATNADIRQAAESVDSFDPDTIAQKVIENSSSSKLVKPSSEITLSQKLDLVQVEALEMGITLTESQVLEVVTNFQSVADGLRSQADESVDFLVYVRGFIQQILDEDYQEIDRVHTELHTSIHSMLNAGSQRVAQRIAQSNDQIMTAINGVANQNTDYKSPFRSSREAMQKILDSRRLTPNQVLESNQS